MTQWHKGPPPSIGWWPASFLMDADVIRWWNGEVWSIHARAGFSPEKVLVAANTPCGDSTDLHWTERPEWWPDRSKT
jgi:hypothetical protein